ncbi:hypothetical protein [Staphylococcus saprophyticus]|uniref:hypothetical protein n=1 Tax=Staphylococcus saprophyticus TaxID=29385 RepID=UPI000A442E63|nr:hypothetical protein [Staphylococcus aureus]MVI00990.1 hypothetical protein [Staphylococcus aureus]MVI25729.1 hypothetical protein [Staphylococcus aureus]MVI29809.1 hypothetical protein [Staphylococcus aureus]MVI58419.1 hypothetical protein [Staphylococcus aureus]
MKNLQDMFKNAEEDVQNRLEGLPVFGSYKEILKQILNINESVFEMLYDEDTENSSDYELENVDLVAVHERLAQFQN